MILSIPKASGKIPHFDNIADIHSSQSDILHALEAFNPMYAGGYAMALMFAPRIEKTTIKSGYFSDYDIYFPDLFNLQLAIDYLASVVLSSDNNSAYETDNAITYKIKHKDSFIHIQVVKLLHGSPKSVLKTFDFINCAIGYTPMNSTIHFHKEAPKFHIDKKLEILEPWMLDNLDERIIDANVIIQLMRFKKYCLRWNYSLGKKAFDKLYDLYVKKPDIYIKSNQAYLVHGGPYDRQAYIGLTNQNIWTAIGPIMKDNVHWKDSLDVHHLMDKSQPLTYEPCDLIQIQPVPTITVSADPQTLASTNEDIPF